jgi:acyl-CoA synthetase (AMP-forming)/AMP-acid ligase II
MIPLIFDWAKQTPDRTAVIFNGRPWSYHAFANAIAVARGYFARRGYVGPGYAALFCDNVRSFWGLSLALRSLGLTTVDLRPVGPAGLVGLPNVRGVITMSGERWAGELESKCTELGLRLQSVSLTDEPALGLDAFEASRPMGGHILLTSGTTGIPKMVLMSADRDADLARLHGGLFGLNQNTVLSVFHFEAWSGLCYKWVVGTWSVGGAVVIEQQPRVLLRPEITHAVLTPQFLAQILAAPAEAFTRNDEMRLAVGAGASTQNEIIQAKARITPHVFSYIASTEAGLYAFTPLDTPEDQKWHRLVPGGRLVEIVDESDLPVPAGEIGRVRISTAGGPTSYLNDEVATRTFFKDGFFYPGDLGIMRSDGRIALQGRTTDVISVRGSKMSPAPIEQRLSDRFGVSGVCLFSMPDDNGQDEVHVVIETRKRIDSEQLIAAIKQELPGAFRRTHFYYFAALPRNELGKVMRQEVRAKAIATRPPLARG